MRQSAPPAAAVGHPRREGIVERHPGGYDDHLDALGHHRGPSGRGVAAVGVPPVLASSKSRQKQMEERSPRSPVRWGENVFGEEVLNGVKTSAVELERGHFVGALTPADDAAASETMGILLVTVAISCCWVLEFALSQSDKAAATKQAAALATEDLLGTPPDERVHLNALGFARYLMSWHVILNNFWLVGNGQQTSRDGQPWAVFARWGALCPAWFFVVSGFCLTYGKLTSKKEGEQFGYDDWFGFMVRRAAPWYPLFAICLVWSAVRFFTTAAEDWSHFLANLFLVHGIIWRDAYFPFLTGDWFLCFLLVYLLLFSPMYQVLHDSTNSILWMLFNIAFLVCVPSAMLEWWFMGDEAWWLCLQLFPSFVVGQGLAFWFTRNCMERQVTLKSGPVPGQQSHQGGSSTSTSYAYSLKPAQELPCLCRFGATLAFLLLGVLYFSCSPYDRVPVLYQSMAPLFLKGGLLPLIGIMVLGLACEQDPLAKLFARAPFRWGEKIALTNYLLQVPVHNAVMDLTGMEGLTWTFSVSLVIASIVLHVTIERPWRRFLGVREK